MMHFAFLRLALRPAMLFWLLWSISLLSLSLKSSMGGAISLMVMPGILGMMLGQLNRDISNRHFSWTLPSLQRRLCFEFCTLGAVICLGLALLLPGEVSLWAKVGTCFVFFSLGSLLKTAQYTFFDFKLDETLLALIVMTLSLFNFESFFMFANQHLVLFLIVCVVLVPLCAQLLFSKRGHRRVLFEVTYPFISSINTRSVIDYHKRNLAKKRSYAQKIPDRFFERKNSWKVIPALFFESTQGIPLWRFVLNFMLVIVGCTLFSSYLLDQVSIYMMIILFAFVMNYQFPIAIKEKLLHPIGRTRRFRINLLGMGLEHLFYILLPTSLVVLFNWLPMPILAFRGVDLPYMDCPQPIQCGLLTAAVSTGIQYHRRRYGMSLPGFLVTGSVGLAIVLVVLSLKADLPMTTFYWIGVNVALLAISHLLVLFYYRKFVLNGDYNLEGC